MQALPHSVFLVPRYKGADPSSRNGRMSPPVPPADVRGNDWTSLDTSPAGTFVPKLAVSVIVTYYEAPEELELTLAALERQSYPRHLFEVLIVDDGSRLPLEPPESSPLKVRVVHQEDLGFGLARARNTGARAAAHDILVFLDCDMLPESDWLLEHSRWHHAASDVLTLGFRSHVDVTGIDAAAVRRRSGSLGDLFADRESQRPQWIEFHMSRTNDLTSDDDDLFRIVTGGNLGVSREFYEAVGGYDESFTQWGAEDTEFGYRAYTRGAVLVPARKALCWHQGEGSTPSEAESASLELQRAKISQLIAHHGFRRAVPGRSFSVPQYVVTVRASASREIARLETVEQVLAGSIHDLVVWIDEPAGDVSSRSREHEMLRRLLAGDPRVRFGSPGGAGAAIPAAPFHITIPAEAEVSSDAVERLRGHLGSSPAASTNPVDYTSGISIVRSWVLHRAARRGLTVAECEAVKPLNPDETGVESARPGREKRSPLARRIGSGRWFLRRTARRLVKLKHFFDRNTRRCFNIIKAVWREASGIRSLHDVRQFIDWAIRSVAIISKKRLGEAGVRLRRDRQAHYRLGPEMITVGPVASAVFSTAARIGKAASASTQVAITDTPQQGQGIQVDTVVVLSELDPSASVPAFDAERFNPRGWNFNHGSSPATLGPRHVSSLDPDRLRRLSRAHHVKDSAGIHDGIASRAGTLAALAATGAVVRLAEPDAQLGSYLGTEFYSLLTDDLVAEANSHQRETLSIAMRRCALRDHSLRARARQVLAGTDRRGPPLPLVTVLLATKRPHRLAAAVESAAGQTYPEFELVLALHGEGFEPGAVEEIAGSIDRPCRVVPVPGHVPLGAVLNAAVAESTGRLLTKFDDDDFYGPEHLWDLVLAHEYSMDCLVGKAAEYVYLEDTDRTIHRFRNRSERRSASLAGGAMMIARHDLDALLGWREVPAGVDRALIEDVLTSGRRAYRTHGRGYMLVRHNQGHTWQARDTYFLKQADEVREGCDLAFAGVV